MSESSTLPSHQERTSQMNDESMPFLYGELKKVCLQDALLALTEEKVDKPASFVRKAPASVIGYPMGPPETKWTSTTPHYSSEFEAVLTSASGERFGRVVVRSLAATASSWDTGTVLSLYDSEGRGIEFRLS